MGLSLVDIPLDVLMEISREVDLPDSLHLTATCTTFTPLLLSRYFWIAALNRLENFHRRPPPCPPGTDIPSLPLGALKELTINAYKLRKNLSSESPRPVSVKTIKLEDSVTNIIPIPGTRLIITASSSRLACWDTISGECVGAFYQQAKPQGLYGNSAHVCPGSCSIGVIYQSRSTNTVELSIICFDYQNSTAAVKVSKVFSKTWTPPGTEDYDICQVTIDKSTIAAILVKADDAFLLVCRLQEGIIHSVPLGLPRDTTWPRCIIVRDDFYITRQYLDLQVADLIHIQTSAPQPHALDFQIHKTAIRIPFSTSEPPNNSMIGGCDPRFPNYGVLNVTYKSVYLEVVEDEEDHIYSVHFWPVEHDGSTLTLGSLCFYEHPSDFLAIVIGSSATSGIIVDKDCALGLVQYLSHPKPHVEFRRLDVPELEVPNLLEVPSLGSVSGWSMTLDDRLGVLYLGHGAESGIYHLSVVSYS
ncbi:hypothetical protein B0H13DRAFT_775133 [Mycena leptocephala]|nr:hypothetical protein B0H13DRAFT_775133 [Mycena leptocephala]